MLGQFQMVLRQLVTQTDILTPPGSLARSQQITAHSCGDLRPVTAHEFFHHLRRQQRRLRLVLRSRLGLADNTESNRRKIIIISALAAFSAHWCSDLSSTIMVSFSLNTDLFDLVTAASSCFAFARYAPRSTIWMYGPSLRPIGIGERLEGILEPTRHAVAHG